MENNTVSTVISYCTKGLTAKQNKSLSLPYTTSPLKAEFLIWLKGVNFWGVLFCGFFFLWELIFADRGQPAKFAKIRTRKIFMLRGISTNLTANTADFFFRIHKRVRIHYVYGNPIHKRLHRSINSRKFICGNKVFPFDSRFKLSGHTSVVANKYAAFGSSCLFTESAI